ncbi:hypothetical protein BC828DRAFT_405007 [Blastocladiella britannica]|nr:hypothetical protein BC828DRAFT_405007 [Blastocladiella britannica]
MSSAGRPSTTNVPAIPMPSPSDSPAEGWTPMNIALVSGFLSLFLLIPACIALMKYRLRRGRRILKLTPAPNSATPGGNGRAQLPPPGHVSAKPHVAAAAPAVSPGVVAAASSSSPAATATAPSFAKSRPPNDNSVMPNLFS